MKTKIEIKSIFGNVLFEYEKENNTIKDTLEEAVRSGADLRGAYLRGADLRGADLRGAYLRGADLFGADLFGADLRGADLFGADLGDANLGDDRGKLKGSSDVLIVGPLGSRDDYTTIYHTDKGIFVQCGCFQGTLDDFAAKVKEKHKGNKHEKDYLAMVEFVKIKFNSHER